jgi:hypothetical protein
MEDSRPSPRMSTAAQTAGTLSTSSSTAAEAAAAGGSPSKADGLAGQLRSAQLSDSSNAFEPGSAAAAAAAAGSNEAGAGCSSSSSTGTHVCVPDARNENVLVGIRDGVLDTFDLVWRPQVGCPPPPPKSDPPTALPLPPPVLLQVRVSVLGSGLCWMIVCRLRVLPIQKRPRTPVASPGREASQVASQVAQVTLQVS